MKKQNRLAVLLFAGFVPIVGDPPVFVLDTPDNQTAEVRIKKPERKILVRFINRKQTKLPQKIGITLRSSDGLEREIELSTIDSKLKNTGYYHGSLPPTEESYVGAMLTIPLKKTESPSSTQRD